MYKLSLIIDVENIQIMGIKAYLWISHTLRRGIKSGQLPKKATLCTFDLTGMSEHIYDSDWYYRERHVDGSVIYRSASGFENGQMLIEIEKSEDGKFVHDICRKDGHGKVVNSRIEMEKVLNSYQFQYLHESTPESPRAKFVSALSERAGKTIFNIDLDRSLVQIFASGRWTWMACYLNNSSKAEGYLPVLFDGEENVKDAFTLLYLYELFGTRITKPPEGLISKGLKNLLDMASITQDSTPRYSIAFIEFQSRHVLPHLLRASRADLEADMPKQHPQRKLHRSLLSLIEECNQHISNYQKGSDGIQTEVENMQGYQEARKTRLLWYPLNSLNEYVCLKLSSSSSARDKSNADCLLTESEEIMIFEANEELFSKLHRRFSDFVYPEIITTFTNAIINEEGGIQWFAEGIDLLGMQAEGYTTRILTSIRSNTVYSIGNDLMFDDCAIYNGIPLFIKTDELIWTKDGHTRKFRFGKPMEGTCILKDYYLFIAPGQSNSSLKVLYLRPLLTGRNPVEYHHDLNQHCPEYDFYLFKDCTWAVSNHHLICWNGSNTTTQKLYEISGSHISSGCFKISSIARDTIGQRKLFRTSQNLCFTHEIQGVKITLLANSCNITSTREYLLKSLVISTKDPVQINEVGQVIPTYVRFSYYKIEPSGTAPPNHYFYLTPVEYRTDKTTPVLNSWFSIPSTPSLVYSLVQLSLSSVYLFYFHREQFTSVPINWKEGRRYGLHSLQARDSGWIHRDAGGVWGRDTEGKFCVGKVKII